MLEFGLPFLGLVLFFLLLCSAFFSSSETAMMRVNRYRLLHDAKSSSLAKRTYSLVTQPEKLLGTILIGNTFANIFASSIATILCIHLFGEQIGLLIASIGMTTILLLFGEIIPKTIAALNAAMLSRIVTIPLWMLMVILHPIVHCLNQIAGLIIRAIGLASSKEHEHLNRHELRSLVTESGGMLSANNKRMLLGILELEDIHVESIMVPASDIFAVNLNEDWERIRSQITHSSHTLLPVYETDLNNMLGLLHVRHLLDVWDEDCNTETIRSLLTAIPYIPEGTPLYTQLLAFQKNKMRAGMVVDEYGDIIGMITLADILEEIVGEFTTDFTGNLRQIIPQKDGSYLIDGSLTVRSLNRKLGLQLPEKEARTLSGLITNTLEMIPVHGLCLRINGYPIEILQMSEKTVKLAKIFPNKIGNK